MLGGQFVVLRGQFVVLKGQFVVLRGQFVVLKGQFVVLVNSYLRSVVDISFERSLKYSWDTTSTSDRWSSLLLGNTLRRRSSQGI